MPKPAKVKVRVSTQPVVLMEAEVARKIRQHARTSMKAEVCGVLIGNTEHERMTVEACIAGINAAQGGAHVTFTQDTWEHIYKIKDKEYPDHKIVGWYHSHPGFGVFLSEHDLFIQQNFFSNPQQVAWVYDPHTDEEGCFGWVGGNIEKLSAIRVGYSQVVEIADTSAQDFEEDDAGGALDPMVRSDRDQRSPQPWWMKWTFRAAAYLSGVLLGFLICFLYLNWRWEPVFEQAVRYEQLVDALRQFDAMHPGVLSFGSGGGPNGLNQPPAPQEKIPAENKNEKGNDGKH
jgi:proteasome lid subunit RPN8/RPN11